MSTPPFFFSHMENLVEFIANGVTVKCSEHLSLDTSLCSICVV